MEKYIAVIGIIDIEKEFMGDRITNSIKVLNRLNKRIDQ